MSTKMVEVTVQADPGTEFVITDSRRVKVHDGSGRRSFTLPPGIYKMRFMAGDLSSDQLFEIDKQAVTLRAPNLEIASPIPLQGTSTTHEYHEVQARNLSRLTPLKLGKGSELAFLVRDSSKQLNVGPPSEPWHGLMLQRLVGITDVEFASDGMRDGNLGLAAIRVEVDPDTFLLTLVRKSGAPLQLPVTATPGWRTTVYLDCAGNDGAREPDLYGASVVISGLHDDFYPDDPALKLADLAKLAIQKGRASVDAAALSGMMSQKFTYPMLGILAAHVLLIEEKPDLPTLKIVLKNLDKLVPGHPDVCALHCGLARHEPEHKLQNIQLSGPPMLRNSWDMLIEASSRYPHLLPVNAEWMQYAFGLSGSRVWMVWQRPPVEEGWGVSFAPALGETYLGKASWNSVFESLFLRGLRNKAPTEVLASLMERAKTVLANDEGRLDSKQLIAIWSALHEALKDPSIARSPLQSTLRRKLLSVLDEGDTDQDVALTLETLARDLRVPIGVLILAANSLFVAAQGRNARIGADGDRPERQKY